MVFKVLYQLYVNISKKAVEETQVGGETSRESFIYLFCIKIPMINAKHVHICFIKIFNDNLPIIL